MAWTDSKTPVAVQARWVTVALLLMALVPVAFHAKVLLPEVSLPVPSLNDDAVHYLLVKRGSEALAAGENPFDHWVPEVEFGFPWFFYYQHLPHLAVILLHRLLLKQVDLLTLFNLIRYLLLLGFPLTVYWSMRRLEFSPVAGAISASAAMLLSSSPAYGFDYTSYVWRGLGMYTQLWAMHLFFITLACLHEVLERGKGYVGAVVASSLLALSHLIYAYMMAVTALVLLLLGLNRANARPRMARLAVTGALGAAISSYFWLPLAFSLHYMNASPYLQQWKYDSFGARDILTRLLNGELLDSGRLPVLTVLLALGVASALLARTPPARLSLTLFLLWLVLFFGRATWGGLADLLPMAKGLLFHRFVGGVHLGALLLIGLGGEWVWQQVGWLSGRWRAVAAGLLFLSVMVPALRERQGFYALNRQWMERTRRALDADDDARAILSVLGKLPPGRTHAGLYGNWGKDLKFGDLHFFNLLTFYRFAASGPPYPSFSLNADMIFHFNERNPAHYDLFNVRYLIAPSRLAMPEFLRRIKETPRYVLYQADTSGSAMFATVTDTKKIGSQSDLFARNLSWLTSGGPALGRFLRYDYPEGGGESGAGQNTGGVSPSDRPGCPGGGKITEERVLPGRIDLRVECPEAAPLVLKVTYHPNWRVTIDGREERTYMVSPSFIGVDVPAGLHQIRAEYRSPAYKTVLLLLGACTLLAIVCFRPWLARLDALLASRS